MKSSVPPAPSDRPALVWFRRDLRATDHAALYHALRGHRKVHCAFVFDTEILDPLPRADRRVEFIHASVVALDRALAAAGGGLIVMHDRARDAVPRLAAELGGAIVYANHDYEPQAIDRDAAVGRALASFDSELRTFKDQAIFEGDEVRTQAGTPFTVFTPYKNAWLRKLSPFYMKAYPVERYFAQLVPPPRKAKPPSLADLGFEPTNLRAMKIEPGSAGADALFEDFLERIDDYTEARNYPAVKGPSYLSVHLRFGTISIRRLARAAFDRRSGGADTWLSELIWRDFYFQILAHFPHVVTAAFRPEYDKVAFDDAAERYAAWCDGRTGYPLVDAAMRQINRTGYMHNRLRMIVASFLTKDLHVHWSRGEDYFARHLIDFDLSANNGGWQWAASSGCDAQPYFRIFSPVAQSERFDPEGKFIRRYCPELAKVPAKFIHAPWTMPPAEQQASGVVIGRDYPHPIVDHDVERRVALERYGAVKRTAPEPADAKPKRPAPRAARR